MVNVKTLALAGVVGIGIGIGIGYLAFNRSKVIAALTADLSNNVKEAEGLKKTTAALEADLSNNTKEVERLKANVERLSKVDTALESTRADAETLAACVRRYSSLRKPEGGIIALWAGIMESVNALKSYPDSAQLKKLSADCSAAVEGFAKEAESFLAEVKVSDEVLKRYNAQSVLAEDDNLRSLERFRSISKVLGDIAEQCQPTVFKVYANQDWQASRVEVHKGDIYYVRVEGTWASGQNLDTNEALSVPASAGWDGPGARPAQVTDDAPFGAMIMRIRGSEKIRLAYSLSPIQADEDGMLEFRINRVDLSISKGVATALIVKLDGGTLAALPAPTFPR